METLIIGLIMTIAVAVIGFFIVQIKADGRLIKFYYSYQTLFMLSGEVIKQTDEVLYKEMKELSDRLAEAYKNPEFTECDLKDIIKEAKDVYYRALAIIKK